MKIVNLSNFEKQLEIWDCQSFPRLFGMISKEVFHRQKAIEACTKSYLNLFAKGETSQYDAEADQFSFFFDEISSLSFFSTSKLLILNNAEKLTKAEIELLEKSLITIPPSISIALSFTALAVNTRLYKGIEKNGCLIDIPEEKSWEKEKKALEWLLQEAVRQHVKIDPKAAQVLVKQIGPDYALLAQELEKLICYTFERKTITSRDIETLSIHMPSETAWQLGEAIFLRNSGQALRIAQSLLQSGVAFLTLLRQIRSQFQTELQVCSILTSGGSAEHVSQQFPYMKGRILELHLNMAKSYGLDRFCKGMVCIDEHELIAKNNPIEHELLAQRLIFKLTL